MRQAFGLGDRVAIGGLVCTSAGPHPVPAVRSLSQQQALADALHRTDDHILMMQVQAELATLPTPAEIVGRPVEL